jgi:energy-coupling factor transporter transmembrane protein EcfT
LVFQTWVQLFILFIFFFQMSSVSILYPWKTPNDLIWKFLWDNKPNQIERNVCCLNINEEGMGMINIDNFVKSKQTWVQLFILFIFFFQMSSVSILYPWKTPKVFILSEIHDMLVNLGRFPLKFCQK